MQIKLVALSILHYVSKPTGVVSVFSLFRYVSASNDTLNSWHLGKNGVGLVASPFSDVLARFIRKTLNSFPNRFLNLSCSFA